MKCPEQLIGAVAAAFGLGVLIGGLLPCLVVKWLCGCGLIAVGMIMIRI